MEQMRGDHMSGINKDLAKLAQLLRTDPRFRQVLNGQVSVADAARDPAFRQAMEDVAQSAGPIDPGAAEAALLQGENGQKVREALKDFRK